MKKPIVIVAAVIAIAVVWYFSTWTLYVNYGTGTAERWTVSSVYKSKLGCERKLRINRDSGYDLTCRLSWWLSP